MVNEINLNTLKTLNNLVLVKPDPNYDFVELQGEDGKVKIYLSYSDKEEANHVSITGDIIAICNDLVFSDDLLSKSKQFGQEEKAAKMRSSMPFKTKLNLKVGDKIYFDYHNHFNAENEGRLCKVEGIGYCLLMKYDQVYGKQINNKFVPINGWVLFKRHQEEAEYQTDSGLTVIKKTNMYGSQIGEVIAADTWVESYLDGGKEEKITFKEGDKFIFKKNFGYRIAYSVHAGDMAEYEVIKRRHIFGKYDDIVSDIKKHRDGQFKNAV